MARRIEIQGLADAIEQELTTYGQEVTDAVNAASSNAVKALVKRTRAAAPVGARGSFRKNIASKVLKKTKYGDTYVWYVKAPDHRLTHLLVRGHAKKDGGRTRADPFLINALSAVLPEYERAVEEAVRNGR